MFEFLGMIAAMYDFRTEVGKYTSGMPGMVGPNDTNTRVCLWIAHFQDSDSMKGFSAEWGEFRTWITHYTSICTLCHIRETEALPFEIPQLTMEDLDY